MSIRKSSAGKGKKKSNATTTTKTKTKRRNSKKSMREVEDFFINLNAHLEHREKDPNKGFLDDTSKWIDGEVQMVTTLSSYFGVEYWDMKRQQYKRNQKIPYTMKEVENELNLQYQKTLDTEKEEFDLGSEAFQMRKLWITGRINVLRQTANFFDMKLKN